jgi:acyl-CoA thioester hydrolase
MKRAKMLKTRASYKHFLSIPTRWIDNDIYGHVNNVVYYSYFDTVVNEYLVSAGGLNPHRGEVVGIVAETLCRYHKSISFPDVIDAGLRVATLGNSSVRYEIGIFKRDEDEAAASGYFVHVFVQRPGQIPTPIPAAIRGALERLRLP